MANVAVIGAQWGDEGKGKIVDWLSQRADIVVRFQGGHNAGHTLVIDGEVFKLSLLPSGIVRHAKMSLIGSGVVVDPWALQEEMKRVQAQGVAVSTDNLMISETATMILPVHVVIDQARERRKGKAKIGTTGRGIGPAYEDKVARRAIRLCDLRHPDSLKSAVNSLVEHHNIFLTGLGEDLINEDEIYQKLLDIAPFITPFLGPVWKALDEGAKKGKRILYEGAQGVMLDVDYGTYPYVTSSNTVAGQAATGAGIGPHRIRNILGIVKAYTTRVGSGPFPTEQDNEIGTYLGEKGREFGTVTGRKRRCGWLDAVLLRQAIKISGINGIVLTKLDVLDGLKELKICIGYELDGKSLDYLPAGNHQQSRVQPIYETLEGWQENTVGAKSYSSLPASAVKYLKRIEELLETPIHLLSTSPERDDTILLQDPFAD